MIVVTGSAPGSCSLHAEELLLAALQGCWLTVGLRCGDYATV